jgi:hypothetical protein
MSLTKTYVRGGANREILGSVTTGYSGGTSSVVRDKHNHIIGRTSDLFNTTRDDHGKLVSIDAADPGLLIGKRK